MNELLKRIIVAVIGIPIAIAVIWVGGIIFAFFVAIISSMALWEFYKLAEHKGAHPYSHLAIVINIILIFILYFILTAKTTIFEFKPEIAIVVSIIIMIMLLTMRTLWSDKPNAILNFAVTLTGIVYISFSFLSIVIIRDYGSLKVYESVANNFGLFISGKEHLLILTILFSIWICDTAAYFIGKKFGRHKLFPSVSPKKTWEGAIAGFITGTGFFVLFLYILIHSWFVYISQPYLHSVIIGMLIGSLGQIGDLAESKFKRDAGVKDSSSILPGHGGIYDRFDSIIFIFPIILVYIILFMN